MHVNFRIAMPPERGEGNCIGKTYEGDSHWTYLYFTSLKVPEANIIGYQPLFIFVGGCKGVCCICLCNFHLMCNNF